MLFDKLKSQIELVRLEEAEMTAEERKEIETEVVYGNLVSDLSKNASTVEETDVLGDTEVKAEDLKVDEEKAEDLGETSI